ncbi:hypothetical protein DKL61_09550 [Gammaproteobacteria bacterium ESL0073]|nr:hypothetical protein DKL61_09550 [Gammaproteobacteria bacterium ESL0073]
MIHLEFLDLKNINSFSCDKGNIFLGRLFEPISISLSSKRIIHFSSAYKEAIFFAIKKIK